MQVPVDWLREYVDFDESLEEIAHKMTMAGAEVGEIATERFGYDNSFVGKIVKTEAHPKKDGFFVLTVAGGDIERIVLTNLRPFEVGEIIPVAYEGFTFPDGKKLEPMKFGGIESAAKIMSEWDVEYSKDAGVILPLPKDAPVGACIPDVMGITCKVFVFDLTPNRGDLLCVFGLARELAAILGKPLKKNVFDVSFPEKPGDVPFSVDIKDPDLCPRYSGRIIQEIKIEESPVAMKRRLIACGMRPINGIVDVTNYVMLEAGQPLHAFDLDTLEDRAIIVRRAENNETILTIDGKDRQLNSDMLVIADKSRPVAVAGVMGGMLTEITDKTKNMLLESAHFEPRNLRRTALKLDMRSEASLRFEKGVPVATAVDASNYAAYLIHKNGWGAPLAGLIDANPKPYQAPVVSLSFDKVRNFISPELTDKIIEDNLNRLGFKTELIPGGLKATAPENRFDISIWQDLAEEVARMYGFENITSGLPFVKTHRATMTPSLDSARRLRNLLVGCGLTENVSFSFTNAGELAKVWGDNPPAAVPLRNPLTEDHTHLRPSLIPNMLKTISNNLKNAGDKPMQMFELGKIFLNPAEPTEKNSLVIGVTGKTFQTPTKSDYRFDTPGYFLVKGIVEQFLESLTTLPLSFVPASNPLLHPFRSAEVHVGGKLAGVLGEVHPKICADSDIKQNVAIAEFDLDVIVPLLNATYKYNKVSRQPALLRDISIVVSEDINAQTIEEIIRSKGGSLLESVGVFDVFHGEILGAGKKSISFKLMFRHADRTLNDDEVSPVMEAILADIKLSTGGALRDM
ncbi:MAG: phenylalanine--tRNA ligase subunit beta [bacterium]